jgi:hypothetical protein
MRCVFSNSWLVIASKTCCFPPQAPCDVGAHSIKLLIVQEVYPPSSYSTAHCAGSRWVYRPDADEDYEDFFQNSGTLFTH